MLPSKDKKTLQNLLSLAPEPEHTLNYDELCGFLFGLAMTPEQIPQEEWFPVIFGDHLPQFKTVKDMAKMTSRLNDIFQQLLSDFQNDSLSFPFDLDKIQEHQLEAVYSWVSGFEEAMAMREELWDPEEFPKLAVRKKEDLMHSLMTIQGLLDPTDMLEMFEQLPDDVFQEAFPSIGGQGPDRELQIQIFLLASLPLSIETLQDHARAIVKKRRKKAGGQSIPIPIRQTKSPDGDGCSCPGGGSCCGPQPPAKKEAKIIKVDFTQGKKKGKAPTAPIFQLKINLQYAKPPIWRRIQVPGDMNLETLHKIIQLCMGWTDSHLHQFRIDGAWYSLPDEEDDMFSSKPKDEAKFTLQTLQKKILPGFQYIYDYGDDWLHQISVEKVLSPNEGKPYPVLMTGKRACPPEDIGGIPGFLNLIEVLKDPEDENYEEYLDWLDEEYDPARFGKEEIALINAVLEEMYG